MMGNRGWWALFAALLCCAWLWPDAAAAQSGGWPTYYNDGSDPHAIDRGPGWYFALWKMALVWLLFMVWVPFADWVNRDSQGIGSRIDMPPEVWNPIVVFPFFAGLIAVLAIPIFLAGYAVMFVAAITPIAIYVVTRNGKVREADQVFTFKHIGTVLSGGGGKSLEGPLAHQEGPPVEFTAAGVGDEARKTNLIAARQSPLFIAVKDLIAGAFSKRAELVVLDYTPQAVAVQFQIDGVWHNLRPTDRQSGDVMLAILKKLADLNMYERGARQEGKFKAEFRGQKFNLTFTSQGVPTGERAVIKIEGNKKEKLDSLEELGMRPAMREQFQKLMNQRAALVIVSAPPENGLKTTYAASLRAADRLLRDFISIQDQAQPWPDVINLETARYDLKAGQTPDLVIPKVLLKQPEVLVVPDLVNGKTAQMLCAEVLEEQKSAFVTVRAKEAVEALLRVLALQTPAEPFARACAAVLNVRLVRKLCEKCKQPYQPDPRLLAQMGLPPDRVRQLYREYVPPTPQEIEQMKAQKMEPPPPCEHCGAVGYRGRTALFELLVMNDVLRQTLLRTPNLDALRMAAKQTGSHTLLDEGVVLVAAGVTSLVELQRVMKQ